ncbi:MAG: sulfurtransferase TusA family protein [Proteobacteria bacterium]|nr:sulfurtransferase TusA family protein [Pseudomonadota bacterium]MBS0573676.1 sulfurtransferase TusA family protein [Pseudomonadota bacterium]
MSEPTTDIDAEIDAAGLLCPLPVLKAQRRLRSMRGGAVLRLIATDPASWVDVPHFCATGGHELLSAAAEGETRTYLIRKGKAPRRRGA